MSGIVVALWEMRGTRTNDPIGVCCLCCGAFSGASRPRRFAATRCRSVDAASGRIRAKLEGT